MTEFHQNEGHMHVDCYILIEIPCTAEEQTICKQHPQRTFCLSVKLHIMQVRNVGSGWYKTWPTLYT